MRQRFPAIDRTFTVIEWRALLHISERVQNLQIKMQAKKKQIKATAYVCRCVYKMMQSSNIKQKIHQNWPVLQNEMFCCWWWCCLKSKALLFLLPYFLFKYSYNKIFWRPWQFCENDKKCWWWLATLNKNADRERVNNVLK